MKLAEALAHLTESCPNLFPLKAGEGLAEVESMIKAHRKDLRAMEVVAHSYRAKERWGARAVSPPAEVIKSMELPELKKLQRQSHRGDTRECLNAEVLKRITQGGNHAAEPDT